MRSPSISSKTEENEVDTVEPPLRFPGLDWMIELLELFVVIGFGLLVLMATAFLIWHGEAKDIPTTRTFLVLKMLHDHWIGALIIMVVLFYRPISSYLGRLEKLWGTEAPRDRRSDKKNPPSSGGES